MRVTTDANYLPTEVEVEVRKGRYAGRWSVLSPTWRRRDVDADYASLLDSDFLADDPALAELRRNAETEFLSLGWVVRNDRGGWDVYASAFARGGHLHDFEGTLVARDERTRGDAVVELVFQIALRGRRYLLDTTPEVVPA